MNSNKRGQTYVHHNFVNIEGNDGAGKSTLLDALDGMFDYKTREPGGTSIAEAIRKIILTNGFEGNDEMDYSTESALYAASRTQHNSQVIQPRLSDGEKILTSRHLVSSMTYQGVARGMGFENILKMNLDICNLTGNRLYLPGLTLYMDSDVDIITKRISDRGTLDRLEKEGLDFKRKINAGYKEVLQYMYNEYGCKYVIIPSGLSIKETQDIVIKTVQKYFSKL